ncbi:MAG: DUF4402 domain-containing protein [Nitrospirota bacterium]|nr:DUF4402 domain-containing protein [Nitrospirota bacterium]
MCTLLAALLLTLLPSVSAWAKNHWPIAVTLVQGLSFPPASQGLTLNYVTLPLDATAAVFNSVGQKGQTINCTIVQPSVNMLLGAGGTPATQILVDTWAFGGSLLDVIGAGQASFSNVGLINNMRVGATAHVAAANLPGAYVGNVTFRVLYL